IGIAVHNFPEGLAIGAGYAASETLGIGLAVVLALHDAPEGMAMAGPMKAAGLSPLRIVATCTLAGVPTGLGSLIGAYFGNVSELFLSVALGFAAGAMLYLVFDELLPIAQELDSEHSSTFGAIIGVVVGILFMALLD
ncbi:MAG TPA: ZIP family metal transporter, partial [Limnochordia bacterium]|nr:ZIP family metal transporter [Limnochordia bacterium]